MRDGNAFDHEQFAELAQAAREALARTDAPSSAELARQALGLWRGAALAGIADEPGVRADAARLEEQRLLVFETRVEADLALGRHAEVISELRAESDRNPAREHLHELLMLALYRAGRHAEALDTYRALRARHISGAA
jgi:DNA-binding SARP family transcriptional activator